jgi:hypothetical protein
VVAVYVLAPFPRILAVTPIGWNWRLSEPLGLRTLEARRREDPLRFAREYECMFGSPEDSLFTPEMLDRMVANDFEPLHL